jgi:hypothetical protein
MQVTQSFGVPMFGRSSGISKLLHVQPVISPWIPGFGRRYIRTVTKAQGEWASNIAESLFCLGRVVVLGTSLHVFPFQRIRTKFHHFENSTDSLNLIIVAIDFPF